MLPYDFLDKLEEILNIDNVPLNMYDVWEYSDPRYGFVVYLQHRSEDLSLYCHLVYDGSLYYYNWNREIRNHIGEDVSEKCVELEIPDDIITKLDAIVNGREVDNKITIPVEMESETFNILARKAHELDITFNEFIEQKVRDVLNDPEKLDELIQFMKEQ